VVRHEIIHRQRIDQATAPESPAILVDQVRNLDSGAEAFVVLTAFEAMRLSPTTTSTNGSSQVAPHDPFRTSAISSPDSLARRAIAIATSSAPIEIAAVSLGT
jgi:hypothetical protein